MLGHRPDVCYVAAGWVKDSSLPGASAIASVFLQSTYQLMNSKKEVDQLALQCFYSAGYCAPDAPIPMDLLKRAVRGGDVNPSDLDRGLRTLYALGLLQASEVGQIVVEREAEEGEASAIAPATPQDQRRALEQGN